MSAIEVIAGAAAIVAVVLAYAFGDVLFGAFIESNWGRRFVAFGTLVGVAILVYLIVQVLR